MMHNNNLVVPTFNGELRTDKPPLHYFFMIVSYKVFGETEFAARFFSVVMGLLTVFVTFFTPKGTVMPFMVFAGRWCLHAAHIFV